MRELDPNYYFPDGKLRHTSISGILKYFTFKHLPPGLQEISGMCADLALEMANSIPEGPELTVGLRKLLEAKDCFVRAKL